MNAQGTESVPETSEHSQGLGLSASSCKAVEGVRRPCIECPFKAVSPIVYDSDALEALDEGYEPSCHAVVGFGAIFEDSCPDGSKACVGHALWLAGAFGYTHPANKKPRTLIRMRGFEGLVGDQAPAYSDLG